MDPRGKFARWIAELESLSYEIRYRKGALNVAADYLSRMPTESDQDVGDDEEYLERHVYTLFSPGPLDAIREAQMADPVISRAIIQLRDKGVVTDGQLRNQCGLRMSDGCY